MSLERRLGQIEEEIAKGPTHQYWDGEAQNDFVYLLQAVKTLLEYLDTKECRKCGQPIMETHE